MIFTGKLKNQTKSDAFEKCCKHFYSAIKRFTSCRDIRFLREIHIVNIDPEVTLTIRYIFRNMSEKEKSFDHKRGSWEKGTSNELPIFEVVRPSRSQTDQSFDDVFQVVNMETLNDNTSSTGSVDSNDNMKEDEENQSCFCDHCKKENQISDVTVLKCRHVFCDKCAVPLGPNQVCFMCPHIDESQPDYSCVICMDEFTAPVRLKTCGHVFCKMCIVDAAKHKPVCPVCTVAFGSVQGNQPDGEMRLMRDRKSLPGYPQSRTYIINYIFPSGKQRVSTI